MFSGNRTSADGIESLPMNCPGIPSVIQNPVIRLNQGETQLDPNSSIQFSLVGHLELCHGDPDVTKGFKHH